MEKKESPAIELGQIGYEAYKENAGGVSLAHGGALPEWGDLALKFKAAWNAAGDAIEAAIKERQGQPTPLTPSEPDEAPMVWSNQPKVGE